MKFCCRKCLQYKTRIRAEYSNSQYVYRDEKGKAWQRRMCPECKNEANVMRLRLLYKKRREEKIKNDSETGQANSNAYIGNYFGYIAPGTKTKPCANCKKQTVNYRLCFTCVKANMRTNPEGYATEAFYEMWDIK